MKDKQNEMSTIRSLYWPIIILGMSVSLMGVLVVIAKYQIWNCVGISGSWGDVCQTKLVMYRDTDLNTLLITIPLVMAISIIIAYQNRRKIQKVNKVV